MALFNPNLSAARATPTARHGEQEDFLAVLVIQYEPTLHAFAARRLPPDPDAAHDVVQMVFLRAWRWRRCLRALTPPQRQAWLYRTTQRCVIDAWRKRRATQRAQSMQGAYGTITFTHLAALYGENATHGEQGGDSPGERVERALATTGRQALGSRGMSLEEEVCTRLEARDQLRHLLSCLPPEEARLLLLVAGGATMTDLRARAARRGEPASRGAVKMRIVRARQSARRVWTAVASDVVEVVDERQRVSSDRVDPVADGWAWLTGGQS